MELLKGLVALVFLWTNVNLNAWAQPYDYPSYTLPDSINSPPPDDACHNIDVTNGLAGEALFKAVVQAHGQSSFGVAVIAKRNMAASVYGPNSPALEALKAFARFGGVYLGYAYGLVDNSSPERCLENARAIAAIQQFFVSQRNNVIPGHPFEEGLTGEAALQCQVKRKGNALFVVEQIGSANLHVPSPGPYLNLLISIVQNIQISQRIVAADEPTFDCNQVALVLGQIFRDFLRVDYTDAEILEAYGLANAEQYQAFYY